MHIISKNSQNSYLLMRDFFVYFQKYTFSSYTLSYINSLRFISFLLSFFYPSILYLFFTILTILGTLVYLFDIVRCTYPLTYEKNKRKENVPAYIQKKETTFKLIVKLLSRYKNRNIRYTHIFRLYCK